MPIQWLVNESDQSSKGLHQSEFTFGHFAQFCTWAHISSHCYANALEIKNSDLNWGHISLYYTVKCIYSMNGRVT